MGHPGGEKRRKEQARSERRKEKESAKADRKKEKLARPPGAPGEDPDLEGIVAGPQPQLTEDSHQEDPAASG